jgi:CelD/BcsL family acetyltransferase involved in cellulose biosynthesis
VDQVRDVGRPGRLVELDPAEPAWMDFVAAAPGATTFHHPAWLAALVAAYGYRPRVLAELGEGERIVAGLALMGVRRLSGRAWISLPFTDHCPPLAHDEASLRHLTEHIAAWGREHDLSLEIRGDLPASPAWTVTAVGTRHVLPLAPGVEALWAGVRKSLRNQVGAALRGGLRVRFSRAPADRDAFHGLMVRTRRRLGVPVQPHGFVAALWRHVIEPGLGIVALAETRDGTAVAASLLLTWNRMLIEKFQASDAAHWQAKPNQLLIWSTIEWGCQRGYLAFDFGRSDASSTGLQRFKASWDAQELPLRYAVAGKPGTRPGGGRLDRLMSEVIRRSPALVCRALGRALYRYAA